MIPYGIVIKQNRIVLQQSLLLWQKKYGLLKMSKFVASAIPLLSLFAIAVCAATVLLEKSFSAFDIFSGILMNMLLVAFIMYTTALKTVKDYAAATKEENIQLVLKEECIEITTEFSKETIPYDEIELCYEKNFLLTLITDKNAFPLCVSKMHFVKGDYDTFVSLLKSRLPHKYEKRGEN